MEVFAYAVMQYRRGAGVSCLSHPQKAPNIQKVKLVARRSSPTRPRLGLMAGAVTASSALEANISLGWSQVSTDYTVRKFFPAEWLSGFKMLCSEDIINEPSLAAWRC